jgi:hypothetical protein
MELLLPHIDPHVLGTDHHVGITGQPQGRRVKRLRHFLVGNGDIDMLHGQDIPHILCAAVVAIV